MIRRNVVKSVRECRSAFMCVCGKNVKTSNCGAANEYACVCVCL